MKIKYALIAVVVIFVIGAAIGLRMFYKPHADINKMKPDYVVEAGSLIGEFEKDENAATVKYREKVLEIKGKLASKNQLSNGTTLFMLEDEMQGISCQLDSSWVSNNHSSVEFLEPGSLITVKGVCKGYLMEIKVSPATIISKN